MWKYTSVEECNNFLLSLNLFKCKNSKRYIKILYSLSNNIENNYNVFKIKKRNGQYRTIYEPNDLLKTIQRNILSNILNNFSISKYAKAYKKGICLKDNAIVHLNKDIILKLDIIDFFDNIEFDSIYYNCFSKNYFPKSIGILLTQLCTYNNHLIQGAPTSAYISNLVMKEFDKELGSWCVEKNISYTRYSDDLTFSGNFNPSIIIIKVRKMLYKYRLELNNKKTKVIKKNNRQSVTGINVNKKLQVNSLYRKKFVKRYTILKNMD